MSSLRDLYAANDYPADVDGRTVTLHHARRCPDLDAALARRGLRSAAYVTAFDPHGRRAPLAQNVAAHARLRDELRHRFHLLDAPGGWPPGAPDPDHQREPSFLVLGITRDDALALARRYEQAAILVHTIGEPTELVMVA